MKPYTTIQLVDDHELVRTGFRYVLDNYEDIKVIAESADGRAAITDYLKHRPDIVFMDISMDKMSGFEAIPHILAHDPQARIIMVSMFSREAATRVLDAGAKGFLSKRSATCEMYDAIKSVMAGVPYIDKETAQQMALYQSHGIGDDPLSLITTREYEIFSQLANGIAIDNIARRCCLSPKTVHSHKSRIMQKLKLKNTVELVLLAQKTGVIGGHNKI